MKIGLLHVMAPPDPERLAAAKAVAGACAAWRRDGDAPRDGPRQLRLFEGAPPDLVAHYALAAPYAHVTAPLDRLCDRYVLELLADGPDELLRADLARLPQQWRRPTPAPAASSAS